MEVFVMRHGTTVWNEKCITQGRSNNRLSQKGKQEIEDLAKKFRTEKIDLIFSSPLMRTVQSANIMNKYHSVKIIKDERITEIGQGILTGRKKSSFSEEENLARKTRDKFGLEPTKDIFERVGSFIEYLKQNYSDKRILIVTHGAIASMMEKYQEFPMFSSEVYTASGKFLNGEIKKLNFR